jgi:hypothetical protein
MHEQVTVIEPDYYNAPEHNAALTLELGMLWENHELGNDFYYYGWRDQLASLYPVIAKYIKDNNITGHILLHYWW